jgi:hypothetical protein
VVPTFDVPLQKYVGAYRCEAHWKQAIAETRAGFLERNDIEFEAGALLAMLVGRGISRETLRAHTSGKMPVDAIMEVLDEIEAGRLVLRAG